MASERAVTAAAVAAALPPLVEQAKALADRTRFSHSCIDEVGRLLHVPASHAGPGTIGEIGTGCGVGTAWMASAFPFGASLKTVELDVERASAVRDLFRDLKEVEVIADDWHALEPHGPFDLLFADGGRAKEREPERVLEMLAPGGLLVLDDLWVEGRWHPAESRGRQDDPVRRFWLGDPRLAATELLVRHDHAVILASRIASR